MDELAEVYLSPQHRRAVIIQYIPKKKNIYIGGRRRKEEET